MRHIINAHAMTQRSRTCGLCGSARAHQRSLIRLMFRGTLLEPQFAQSIPIILLYTTSYTDFPAKHFPESKPICYSAKEVPCLAAWPSRAPLTPFSIHVSLCKRNTVRAHVFLFRIMSACLLQLVVKVVQSSHHALTPRTRVAQDSRSTLFVSCSKTCKDNTSKDHFRSVNLYKEFPYRSESE